MNPSCLALTMWLWANYLAHPSLCSYSCRVGITVPPFKDVCKDEKRCYAEITELRIPCPAKLDSLSNSPWNSPGQHTGVGSNSVLQASSQPRDQTQVSHIAGGFKAICYKMFPHSGLLGPSQQSQEAVGIICPYCTDFQHSLNHPFKPQFG